MEVDTKAFIDEIYDGNTNAFKGFVKRGNANAFSWRHLESSIKVYPELETEATLYVHTLLGFKPQKYSLLPVEAEIRKLIHQKNFNEIDQNEFYDLIEKQVKKIRNREMQFHNDVRYSPSVYRAYESTLPTLAKRAKERLSQFLGYEPEFETAVCVEVSLRQCYASDSCYMPEDKITPTDLAALTIIKYREVLLTNGRNVADNSPLIALHFKNEI